MRNVRLFLLYFLLIPVFTVPQAAWASPIWSGCSVPPTAPTGNVWYVDPINGSMQGNGSQAHPWQTLAGVVAAGLFANMPTHYNTVTASWMYNNPNAPIQSGDTVYLMSGDHGAVTIQGDFGGGLVGYNNSSFIIVQAAPGQTPILDQLQIIGGQKWIFRGLTIQGLNNTGTYATASAGPDFNLVQFSRQHQDIIFDANIVRSTTDTSSWTMTNWITQRASGVHEVSGTCVAVTNNMISNIGFGIVTQSGNEIEVGWNTINYFSDDAIDYGSSNTIIQSNQIYNSVEDGDGFHRDGIQGQPATEQSVMKNVAIKNNTVIRLLDPNLAFPGSLQGIDAFDGIWNFISVLNNTVITDSWNGITYLGANYISISNNIVLQDGGKVMPCYNLNLAACLLQTVIIDNSNTASIMVESAKSGVPSTNVTVSGNIVSGLYMSPSDPLVTVTNNLNLLTGAVGSLEYIVNGTWSWHGKPGDYSGNNIISTFTPAGFFTQFDTTNLLYNLTPTQPNPTN